MKVIDKYHVELREEGRGKPHRESFATLAAARAYIRDRWRGPDYIDGDDQFHTDYSTYSLVGFSLKDVGKRRWCDGWYEWDWRTGE